MKMHPQSLHTITYIPHQIRPCFPHEAVNRDTIGTATATATHNPLGAGCQQTLARPSRVNRRC